MKTGIFACLMLVCSLAQAQTYDLSITMSGVYDTPSPLATFAGSFTYRNGLLSNISVNDPTYYGGTFTAGTVSSTGIQLVDTYDGVPGQSSDVVFLNFGISAPLGSGPVSIMPNSVYFESYGDYPNQCGGTPGLINPNPTECISTSIKAEAAPEIGLEVSALTLLAGALLVMRGRTIAQRKGRPAAA
jgi:hypothetical protein